MYVYFFNRKNQHVGKARAKETAFHIQLFSPLGYCQYGRYVYYVLTQLHRKLQKSPVLRSLADLREGGWEVETRALAVFVLPFLLSYSPIPTCYWLCLCYLSQFRSNPVPYLRITTNYQGNEVVFLHEASLLLLLICFLPFQWVTVDTERVAERLQEPKGAWSTNKFLHWWILVALQFVRIDANRGGEYESRHPCPSGSHLDRDVHHDVLFSACGSVCYYVFYIQ